MPRAPCQRPHIPASLQRRSPAPRFLKAGHLCAGLSRHERNRMRLTGQPLPLRRARATPSPAMRTRATKRTPTTGGITTTTPIPTRLSRRTALLRLPPASMEMCTALLHALAAGGSHAVGAPAARFLRRARCSPSPPIRGRQGVAFGAARRCAAAAGPRTRAPSAHPLRLLTRAGVRCVAAGTFMRVAEGAGGRGSTARVARVAAAAVAAVAAVSGARALAARAFSGPAWTRAAGGTGRLVVERGGAAADPRGRLGGSRRVGPGQVNTHGHAAGGAGRGAGSQPPYPCALTLSRHR